MADVVHADDYEDFARQFGTFWAAIRGDEVVAVVSMRVPDDVDFQDFQNKVYDALHCLSDTVKRGTIIEQAGERCFALRPNHANRNKHRADNPERKPLKLLRMARHLA